MNNYLNIIITETAKISLISKALKCVGDPQRKIPQSRIPGYATDGRCGVRQQEGRGG